MEEICSNNLKIKKNSEECSGKKKHLKVDLSLYDGKEDCNMDQRTDT